jgi:trimeric autotransporter adhesin
MQNRISNHIRANVIAYAALFFALSGTAYALDGPLPGQNQVGSDDIINGEVRNADIGTSEVKANSVAPDSLGGGKIVDRSVKNADLGLGASSSNTIADRGIQGVDVKQNTLTGTEVDELSLDLSLLQKRIASACAAGQAIRAVAQNGTVTCESVGGGGGWSLSGNSGTTASNFLGTTDNQPLNLRVNNARGLRIEPASDGTNQSPNVIGGIADNSVTPGVHSAVIGGGGRFTAVDSATANRVTDDFGTVAGGAGNRAGDDAGATGDRPLATVGGGSENTASGLQSTVGGGGRNTASGGRATVVGGFRNTAQGDFSLAAGADAKANHEGTFVWADPIGVNFASTAPNQFNVRSTGGARLVSGVDGSGNPSSGLELPAGTSGWSTLGNGEPFDVRVNGARGLRIDPASDGTNQSPNVIGGVADNTVTPGVHSAAIGGGGRLNPANPASANKVSDSYGTVGGGANNQAGDGAGTVDDATFATVGGGVANSATDDQATVAGGNTNGATGVRATVSGGGLNFATGGDATVPGGESNTAAGVVSLAAGHGAQANDNGAFVWADSSPFFFPSTAQDQFSVRATGGVRFVSAISAGGGSPTAGVELAPGGGSWSSLSDRAAKRAIEPASGRKVLRRLASVPVSTWSYRAQDDSIRHIGPMAQDFYRAFGLGEDNKHIASVDADGVALAAIKGLSRKLKIERRRRHGQERRLDRLEARVAALERDGAG